MPHRELLALRGVMYQWIIRIPHYADLDPLKYE
ncbi:hypothetical protein BN12_730006 [Nostocoides japonicum T1-X7]|uniref:Uncharacterized protein n=1 Tax=Nostocoides japonicum T1-X7 TaxID=1194083 RepID=A0A077M7N2_9MICO|nr:hypothetical protein BN12_730006 [Tetrasphaera japonica T1-X7]